MDLYPGDIYRAFDGAEACSQHRFVVLSRADLNRGDYFLAVPITTGQLEVRRRLPNCVFFPAGAFGLTDNCVAQADALTQLRKTDLVEPIERLGILSPDALRRVIAAVGSAIGADCEMLNASL